MNFTKDEIQIVVSALHAQTADMEDKLCNQDLSQRQQDFMKETIANAKNVTENLYTLLFQGDYI